MKFPVGFALVMTKDAGDAITLLQSLAGTTFYSSQLLLIACMGFSGVTDARLLELRKKMAKIQGAVPLFLDYDRFVSYSSSKHH